MYLYQKGAGVVHLRLSLNMVLCSSTTKMQLKWTFELDRKGKKNKHTNKQNKQLYPRGQTLNRLLVADESIAASWCWCSDVLKRVLPVCIRIMWKNHKPQVEHCVQEIHDTASEPLNAVISCTNTDSVSVWYHLKHD